MSRDITKLHPVLRGKLVALYALCKENNLKLGIVDCLQTAKEQDVRHLSPGGNGWDALEKAQLCDCVKALPDGLDTAVGEKGVYLSGGQRQRLGIARAVYQDAQVFIFDEPTAALDETLEKDIMDVVFSLENCTIILIAHHLHTLNRCDRIYEVGDLRIQEEDYVPD